MIFIKKNAKAKDNFKNDGMRIRILVQYKVCLLLNWTKMFTTEVR